MPNPTIVSASLDDKELQQSIANLVAHVKRGLHAMLTDTNSTVDAMEKKLKSLGNLKIDSGGSADGGASKRAKAQNAETDAVEKTITARGKQIKQNQETAMSFDQIAAALDKARRTVSDFNTKRASGILPSSEDYKRYEQALARIVEYNDKLKSSAMAMATANEKWFGGFNAKRVNEIFFPKDNGKLAAMSKYYADLEQQSQKTAQSAQRYTEQTEKGNRALQEQKEHLERIKDIASQARKDIGQYGFANITNYRGVVYAENDERAKGLTIEQQIEKIIQEENAARNAQLGTEKQITQEIEQRGKKYVSPNTEINTAFNRMVANKIGLSEQDINNTSTKISALTQYIKQLEQAWSKMTDAERNSPFGRQLRQELQYTTRLVQQARTELTRPINLKNALSGSEKTLDDIAYKMRQLASYRSGLNIETQTKEIDQVNRKYAELQKKMNDVMRKNTDMIASNTALGRSWNYMKNRLAFYFTVGASTQFIKNLIEVRSQYEMNERALGILINSAERGTQIFNELSQMALVSPYTLIELSTAAKQLTAYDVAARDVVDTTRRLADMAAAVGIPIERLTYALGQIKAYGYLNSRDARMFANAGIPLVKQLSDYYTELEGRLVSTADVYDRIKKKAIDYNEVMEVINKMTDQGGKFFDFQAKMADTLKVRLANLTLAWNNMLNDMGKESQGVLTWGIGALREMFLRWKQLDSLIKNAAWVLGIRTALMFIAYSALKVGAALGVTNKQMALSSVFGTRLAGVLKTVAASFKAIVTSPLTWWSLLAIAAVEATQALFGVNEAQKALNESIRNGAKDNYDNISKFIEQYKEVRESLYSTKKVAMGSLYNPETRKAEATLYVGQQVEQDIDKNEAKKAWEAVREQIELTVASSDKYISNLLSISNMSERVRQGFNLLDDVQVVNAALKELDDDTIEVSKDLSAWWNAWQAPDGLIGNIKDYQDELDKVIEKFGSLENLTNNVYVGGDNWGDFNDYQTALERLQSNVKTTTDSIINFIELKGWSGDESKINQVFEQITQKLVLDNQLDPQKAFTLQTEVEEARSKAAKKALLQRINDEKEAYKISHDEQLRQSINADVARYNSWSETNGRSKVEWERFTKWLKEQHISETTAMFRNMDAEDIKSLNFQEGKHAEWVTRMVTQYAKEHKMSYDDAFNYLKSWVKNANQWSIFIPLIISTEDKKSVYDQLGEYDKAVDEADAQIERLTKRINELNAKKKKSKEETEELGRAEQELADARKAKADAEAKGGHGKKEKKDRKEDEKDAKQAETELQKALKDELSTIDKVRSIYKDLTKEGMSHANAVERATRGWNETVNAINRVLQKNGLQKLTLSKFAGIENPRELVNMLQSQLNILVGRGAKPAEIKELQTKIQTLNVDAEKYDLTKITKGLNNELGKLKDEYELAVELDANPELGGMFADMLGFDKSTMSNSIDEYMDNVRMAVDKARMGLGYGIGIDIFGASEDEWQRWAEWVGISNEKMHEFRAMFEPARSVVKKWATDTVNNTKKLEYELAELNGKIAIKEKEQAQLHERIEKEKNETTKHYLELTYQSNEKSIDELRAQALSLMPEYARVFNSITEYSAGVSRRLQRDLMRVFDEAKYDSANKKWTLTGSDGKQTILNDTQYRKEREKLTKEMRKSQAPFKKIKEAFKPSDKNGVVDYAKGIELVSAEVQKLASVASEVGNLAQIFGADEQTVEIINDVATSLNGVATAGEGISKIASGDYIGGAASVLSGIASVIGAWADNGNKKIDAEIKNSELAVKKLELAYIDLQKAVDKAYGTSVIGAKTAAAAAKKLELQELERQLRLEKSRDSKHKDESRIVELQKQIKELRYEIQDTYTEIVNDLMGTDVGSFAENLVSAMVDAFKQGEDAMKVFNDKFDELIDNMIMKSLASRIVSSYIDKLWEEQEQKIKLRSTKEADELAKAQAEYDKVKNMSEMEWLMYHYGTNKTMSMLARAMEESGLNGEELTEYLKNLYEHRLDAVETMVNNAQKTFDDATSWTNQDTNDVVSGIENIKEGLYDNLYNAISQWYTFGEDSDKNLSNLQQGIQGITEDTAGALEAYMNGVSQQVYLQSEYLRRIAEVMTEDANPNDDIEIASLSQILLQLQQSYTVQQSIQNILEGWNNSNGQAVRVELVS